MVITDDTSIWMKKYVLFFFFPNFKENTAIFPNSKGPGPWAPVSKRGVRALGWTFVAFDLLSLKLLPFARIQFSFEILT